MSEKYPALEVTLEDADIKAVGLDKSFCVEDKTSVPVVEPVCEAPVEASVCTTTGSRCRA